VKPVIFSTVVNIFTVMDGEKIRVLSPVIKSFYL